MIYVGAGMWIASWLMISIFAVFAVKIAYKTKIYYFSKCLEKDGKYFDEHSVTEMASRISKECTAI